jgi:tetratricopeptide (TPR) repeat protein
MLETIHEYARERLEDSGEAEAMRRRHAEYFVALAERLRPDTRGGPNQLRTLHQLESEGENVRAALDWSLGGSDTMLGLRLVGALGHFWWRQGHYAEGQRWTTLALDKGDSIELTTPVRATLLDAAGLVAHFSHDRERGKRLHREALALYELLANKREMGWVLIYLGAQSFGRPNEYEEAIAQAEEGLSLLRSIDDEAGVAQSLHVLGELARLNGDHEQATRVFEESLSLARELGDTIRQAFILDSLGYLSLYDDDPRTAARLARDSLRLALEVGYIPHIPACLAGLAAVYMAEGMGQHAARLLGAADALFDAHGFGPRPSDTPDVERTRANLRAQLDKASFEVAWAEGRAMNLDKAIAFALGEVGSKKETEI